MLVQCSFLLQNALRKITVCSSRGRFTFTICSHFRRTGIVVPLYSHATKSTSIPKNHSTHLFGQNLTIPYPNSPSKSTPRTTTKQTNSTPFLHYPIKLPYPNSNPNKSNTNKQNIT